jgi:hypothetical protein
MGTLPRGADPRHERAAAIGHAVLALVDALGLGHTTPTTYDAERLPPGITRDAYLRRHRDRVRAGASGWTRVGAGRVVTAAAWDLDVAAETNRARRRAATVAPAAANDADDDLDRQLGIRVRGRAAR